MDLGEGIRKALARITGAHVVDEETVNELVKELQRTLISHDVNVQLVFSFTKTIKKRVIEEKPIAGQTVREHVIKIVYDELVKLLGESFTPTLGKQRIMLEGLQGSGKTTSTTKLARFYQMKGLKVAVVAADTFRPAAHEQLEQLAKQVNCAFYGRKGASAQDIVREAMSRFSEYDIIIVDTAGRSAFDVPLAQELSELHQIFKPDNTYLVVSADVGQVAGKQAREFHSVAPITGVIVTKMDGSGKGGGALSAVAESGSRIAFIGTGEKPDAFEAFDSKRFVARLCGFPDLPALLEKLKETAQEEALAKAMEDGKLNYEAFLAQMKAMKKMGPLKGILQMMGAYDLPEELVGKSEEKMKHFEAAVYSMTPYERTNPDVMKNTSRQLRVAKGAGLKPEDVKELVSNFEKVSKMMKGLRGNRGMMKKLSGMMPKGFGR